MPSLLKTAMRVSPRLIRIFARFTELIFSFFFDISLSSAVWMFKATLLFLVASVSADDPLELSSDSASTPPSFATFVPGFMGALVRTVVKDPSSNRVTVIKFFFDTRIEKPTSRIFWSIGRISKNIVFPARKFFGLKYFLRDWMARSASLLRTP